MQSNGITMELLQNGSFVREWVHGNFTCVEMNWEDDYYLRFQNHLGRPLAIRLTVRGLAPISGKSVHHTHSAVFGLSAWSMIEVPVWKIANEPMRFNDIHGTLKASVLADTDATEVIADLIFTYGIGTFLREMGVRME